MELKTVNGRISYIEATEAPLSADVGIIRAGDITWIFDVGNGEDIAEKIGGIAGEKYAVISHFHADHTSNLEKISYTRLYGGGFTCKRLGSGIPVEHDLYVGDVHLFPIPSTHSKGCIGLELGDCAFLGDSTYAANIEGKAAYNAGLLQETVKTLQGLRAEKFLLSHSKPFVQPRDRVIAKLETVYSYRKKNKPYIFIEEITESD
ncbi:MAG: hypothetical protein NC203_10200 [Firmicutes bacterium]|nr:hypothetical protein [[Eubacterium] siraeum]MCM1488724.1 hypothetical protein [Bacillota bacterium]